MADDRIMLVYAGAVRREEAIVHAYYQTNAEGQIVDPDRAHLYREPLSQHPIGMIARYVTTAHGKQVQRADSAALRMLDDERVLTEWFARHDAIMTSESAQGGSLGHLDPLAPIKAAYHKLPEEQQGVLIAQVVRYIVTP